MLQSAAGGGAVNRQNTGVRRSFQLVPCASSYVERSQAPDFSKMGDPWLQRQRQPWAGPRRVR